MDRNDPSFSCWYTYSILARAAPSGPLQPYSRRAQNIYHRPKIRPEVAHRIFRPAPKQTGQTAAGFARARQTPRRRQQLAGLFNAWKAARAPHARTAACCRRQRRGSPRRDHTRRPLARPIAEDLLTVGECHVDTSTSH